MALLTTIHVLDCMCVFIYLLGRCASYIDVEGKVVSKYKVDDDKNWEQNLKMLKVIQKKHLPFNFGESSLVKDWLYEHDEKARPMGAEMLLKVQETQVKLTVPFFLFFCQIFFHDYLTWLSDFKIEPNPQVQIGAKSRVAHLQLLRKELGERFLCFYSDMWKNSGTKDHYAASNYSWLARIEKNFSIEPGVISMKHVWELDTGLLDFELFPFESANSENLNTWQKNALSKNGLSLANVVVGIPDGASTCRKAMKLLKAEDAGFESEVCYAHDLARGVLDSIGLGGQTYENPVLVALVKKNARVSAKLRNVEAAAKSLAEAQKNFGVKHPKSTKKKPRTRWNGISEECSTLNLLAAHVNPALESLGDRIEIVETDEVESGDEGESGDDAEVRTTVVSYAALQFTPQEMTMNRELEATLESAFVATQRLQGESGGCTADETWEQVKALHAYYDSDNTKILVPRAITWPLEAKVTKDVKKPSELKEVIQLQRRHMATSLMKRFIRRGPLDAQLMAMKLSPLKSNSCLTGTC